MLVMSVVSKASLQTDEESEVYVCSGVHFVGAGEWNGSSPFGPLFLQFTLPPKVNQNESTHGTCICIQGPFRRM